MSIAKDEAQYLYPIHPDDGLLTRSKRIHERHAYVKGRCAPPTDEQLELAREALHEILPLAQVTEDLIVRTVLNASVKAAS